MGAIFNFLFWLLYIYLSFILIYELSLFLISRLKVKEQIKESLSFKKFLFLIPAYKEDEILLFTIDAIKRLNYPKDCFNIILLNDQCDEKVIDKIKKEIRVIDLNLQSHSKVNSLKKAIPFVNDFDFIVVLDADNLVHPEFLRNINNYVQSETKVIQGLRLPKKIETINEKLDSVTDFIYNQIDRIIPSRIGLTGTLSGSGFAMQSNLFVEYIEKIETRGGFDKILQSELMLRNIPIHICPDAFIYDEKIKETKSYIKQRKRWLYFHFYNSINYAFKLILKGIFNFNFNQFHLGLISLRLPLSLMYFFAFIMVIASLWFNKLLALLLFVLISIFTLMILGFLRQNKILSFQLLLALPSLFTKQIFSFFKLSEAKKDSLKTNHIDNISIDDILNKEKL